MSEDVQYRLMIADDHPLFRGAMREAVTGLPERVDCAEAGSFDDVAALLDKSSEFDLVLLDLSMPGARGFSENEASAPVMEFVSSGEGLQLSLAFMRIKDAKVRKRVLDLVRSLTEEIDKG